MNKVLIVKVRYEMGTCNDTQIDYFKKAIFAGMDEDSQQRTTFEVLVEDEHASAERLLQQVRSEFREHDGCPD